MEDHDLEGRKSIGKWGYPRMTCSFCGISDDRIQNLELHYRKHEIQALNRIASSLENLIDQLDAFKLEGFTVKPREETKK